MVAEELPEGAWDPYEREKKRGEIMAISMLSFQMTLSKNDVSIQNTLLQRIKERNMAPYYLEVCNYFEYTMDTTLYNAMKAVNDSVINQKKEAIALKKDNGSDDDVLDLLISLAHYYYEIGDKNNAIESYTACLNYKMSNTLKMDLWMDMLDVYLFHQSTAEYNEALKTVKKMTDESGDWEHRNRLNIYLGVKLMIEKDFAKVAELYSTAVPTFTSFSVFSFNDLVKYAVITGIMYLPRPVLKSRLVSQSDVEIALMEMPTLQSLLLSFDECRYHDFFVSLLQLEGILKSDPYLRVSNREDWDMNAIRRCTLQSMADSFGVSTSFINSELSRFISEGQIHAKIDRLNNTVETMSITSLNSLYDQILSKGSVLTSHIQSVTKTVDV
ncbi:26S proteasome non-ATPase regulatory subunit 6 [Blastocystis sp. subtype 4]|uniref:26S proteasome non-ATPase regulatory subunit 6 n=1 Tax=Blastocystis sp. subtype 4 TaxID=944170 RepID=UPI00071217EB|nr:26S proteasome non-ATPase regulatory subunit 6 [Blastocystis sp. subtype 4]KNB41500.1 26S proteasome non-ATPase regulatory subunit 6 [Blastocystis sp. subtype 4]|eukprot:XP_014524943.1 26S proteasome non-ATPase regulatory subunit 6 [Blastocystis sp. subtype 4]